MAKHDPYAAFRIPAFRFYAIGFFASLIGAQIQGTAIGWEMYQRTGEPFALGLVGLSIALPTMILSLPAGYLADTFNRRNVVIFSMLGTTLTSLGLAFLSWTRSDVAPMYALLILDAAITVLGYPAKRTLLPQIVPRDIFPNAVTWSLSLMKTGWMVGPALGGLIIQFHIPAAYVASAACTGFFIFILLRLEIRYAEERSEDKPPAIQTLLEGFRFLNRNRLLLWLMALDMFAVLLGGAVYLLPIYAQDILQVGSEGFGILRSAPAIGAFFMAISIVHLPPMKRAGRTLLLAVAGFGVATIIFGYSRNFWLSVAMLCLIGAFDNISMVVRHTLVQLITPDRMRGRITAVNGVFVSASNELGGFESGTVAHFFGPVFSVISGGIGTLVVVLTTALASPRLRTYGALDETKTAEEPAKKNAADD